MAKPKTLPKNPTDQSIHHIQTCTSRAELDAYMGAMKQHMIAVWAKNEVQDAAKVKRRELER